VALVTATLAVAVTAGSQHPVGEHAFLHTALGVPIRWNPCEPIHYQVNLADAPADALDEVRTATERVTAATGIPFAFDGVTERTPDRQEQAFFMADVRDEVWYPVLISWVPEDRFRSAFEKPASRGHALAVARPVQGEVETEDQYTSAVVVVDADAGLASGFAGRYDLGLVLMHELGHVVGLAHVKDPAEVMFADSNGFPRPIHDWGPGDLEGFELLGKDQGCMDHVTVADSAT
jgi:matrixin